VTLEMNNRDRAIKVREALEAEKGFSIDGFER
jgi:hypothetical protein